MNGTTRMSIRQIFTTTVSIHIKCTKRLYAKIRYLLLYVEETFIMGNAHKISLCYLNLVRDKSTMKAYATSKRDRAKNKVRQWETYMREKYKHTSIVRNNRSSYTKDARVNVNDKRGIRSIRNRWKMLDHLCHEDDIGDLDYVIPKSIFDISPRLLCFLLGKLSPYSILALPASEILLVVFAPLWFLLAVFIIPPLLIAYFILTIVWSIMQFTYLKDFDVDTEIQWS